MLKAIILFLLAGFAEIGGGYLVWLWLKEGYHYGYGIIGGAILIIYGVIPTLQDFPSFGRIYAAYGGLFIFLSVLWGWIIDGKAPDIYDWTGTFICLIGMSIMLWAPRN